MTGARIWCSSVSEKKRWDSHPYSMAAAPRALLFSWSSSPLTSPPAKNRPRHHTAITTTTTTTTTSTNRGGVVSGRVANEIVSPHHHSRRQRLLLVRPPVRSHAAAMASAAESATEVLPPTLDSTADPPAIFDGTTRLYISYICPYAQRTWIARNYKGLQEQIKLVPIDLQNRPAWYKEKLYPENKVPSLEHNNEVKGESLDLVKYIDTHFEGPALLPDDDAKRQFAEELLSYSDSFNRVLFKGVTSKEDVEKEIGPAYDKLEGALSRFDDGPFFLGQFSIVDIAYAPFIERFQPLFAEVKNYDITKGRPKLALWIEELNKIEAYKQTKRDTQEILGGLKKHFGIN